MVEKLKENNTKHIINTKYKIGDRPYLSMLNQSVEIKGIIISITDKGTKVAYTSKDNMILMEEDLLDKMPLLNEYEKRFLRHLVVCLKITKIRKVHLKRTNYEWLDFQVNDRWYSLPHFKKGSMYVGLDNTKEYNVKDLDL